MIQHGLQSLQRLPQGQLRINSVAAAATKPRVHRTAKPISKSAPKANAVTAIKPTQATSAEKTAAAILQRANTQAKQ